MDGSQLHDLVRAYHDLGIHRAGTDVDRQTVDWMADQLERQAMAATRLDETFDRYETTSSLVADGVEIDHLPLFYEWVGTVDTTDVEVVLADPTAGGRDDSLAGAIEQANDADALIVATDHPAGSLVAVNREARPHGGKPTVLIAGRDHSTVANAEVVHLRLAAATVPGTTTNVRATNEVDADGRGRLLLTTPLTGWFGCAGERGTGVAVMLAVAERLAHLPLTVLATGAHELDYLGVRRWVAAAPDRLRAIVHVGASVAVDEPDEHGQRTLIPTRLAMTDQVDHAAETIGNALDPAGFIYRPATDRWLGESEVFCALDVPMLSFTGSGVAFHTPEDTPDESTSPAALELVSDAIANAAGALWLATGHGSSPVSASVD